MRQLLGRADSFMMIAEQDAQGLATLSHCGLSAGNRFYYTKSTESSRFARGAYAVAFPDVQCH